MDFPKGTLYYQPLWQFDHNSQEHYDSGYKNIEPCHATFYTKILFLIFSQSTPRISHLLTSQIINKPDMANVHTQMFGKKFSSVYIE